VPLKSVGTGAGLSAKLPRLRLFFRYSRYGVEATARFKGRLTNLVGQVLDLTAFRDEAENGPDASGTDTKAPKGFNIGPNVAQTAILRLPGALRRGDVE
jgi:hypothetical protein